MVCVRCGGKLGVGKLICERCGTAVGVDESAVKNVNIRKLETGDLIYFMPEKPLGNKTQEVSSVSFETVALPDIKSADSPRYTPKDVTTSSGDTETRKTVFKYMSESKSRLVGIQSGHTTINPDAAVPLRFEAETPVYSNAAIEQDEDESSNFWDSIDDVESGLRDAAGNLSKNGSIEETDIEAPEQPDLTSAAQNDPDTCSNDHADDPSESLYRTDYKKSADAMSDVPDSDYEFKAPLGMKPVSMELISAFESPNEKSLTTGEWLSTVILLLIPGINLIALIIWALGGCKKMQKTLFARALLIIILILLAVTLAVYFVFFRGMFRFDTGFLYSIFNGISGFFQRIYAVLRGIFK